MKKIVIGCFLLFVTVLVTLYSCSKKDAYWDSVSSQGNTLSVSDAKNWYENQFAGDIADIKGISGSGKNRLVSYSRGVFAGVPDWSRYQKYRNNSNAITVQLDYPDTGRGYRGFRDLVIVKNNRKQTFNAYVQLEIFSKSYLKGQIKKKGELPDIRSYSDPATFTGSVLLFSVDNEFIRGARYQNGKVVARIFPRNGISGMVSSISNSMHASKTYVAFNGGASVADIEKDNGSKSVAFNKSSQSISYEEPAVRTASSASGDSNDSNDSNDSHDSFDDTHDLGDVTVISTKPNTNDDSWDTDGAHWGDSYPTQTDPTPTNPSTGGGGGSGGGNSFVVIETKNLTKPCLISVVNSLLSASVQNELSNLIKNTFGNSDKLNLTFFESNASPGTTNAYTTAVTQDGIVYAKITFYDRKLLTASKEYIAETAFHEMIHSYLYSNNQKLSDMSHQNMIVYIDCERTALKEIFPNLSDKDANALILGGLKEGLLKDDPNYDFNQLLQTYNISSGDMNTINGNYAASFSGTPGC